MTSLLDLHHGDCLEVLASLPCACVDAIVTDPPYGLSFMGRKWDYDVPATEIWEQCLRVLKPGGHLLAFAGTRTQHRMAVNIEDAGFEIRDMIAWVYGSGFPKSMDVSKAFDRQAGVLKPESKAFTVAGYSHNPDKLLHTAPSRGYVPPSPVTPEAQQWAGWGTALKPALEPITVARKPFKGTVAQNVLEHGTGGLNIDRCRVPHVTVQDGNLALNPHLRTHINGGNGGNIIAHETHRRVVTPHDAGRWPANLIHDGSDEVVQLFPEVKGQVGMKKDAGGFRFIAGDTESQQQFTRGAYDCGSAARFFYTAKASKDDRDKGNTHPTVKPTDLMAYLCRLVTPPGGIVLDPFMGSGTTGKAALSEGFGFIGIERDADYYAICESRFNGAQIGLPLGV